MLIRGTSRYFDYRVSYRQTFVYLVCECFPPLSVVVRLILRDDGTRVIRRSCVDTVSCFVADCLAVSVRPVFCCLFDIDSLVFLSDAHEDIYSHARFASARHCELQRGSTLTRFIQRGRACACARVGYFFEAQHAMQTGAQDGAADGTLAPYPSGGTRLIVLRLATWSVVTS